MSETSLTERTQCLRDFAKARDWDQYHSPKNLSMALGVEVSEIVEHLTNHGCSTRVQGAQDRPNGSPKRKAKTSPKKN